MKLWLVAFPTERAAQTGYCDPDELDEVLKCFNLNVYATLYCFWSVGVRHLGRRRIPTHFPAMAQTLAKRGKLPWPWMLIYFGKFAKNPENRSGGEHLLK
jgi:hypothetical protein